MFARLENLEKRLEDMEKQLSVPETLEDQEQYRKLAKTHAEIKGVVDIFRRYKATLEEMEGSRALCADPDPEIQSLAQEESKRLKEEIESLERELTLALLPRDPMDDKNVILEIRAGTGGDEAALFAADLFRMYSRYAENRGWKVEAMSASAGA
ncbi:MAG: PCRF domain-containing protein, partial [Deltaproteobacteria bacterium]|nr:PCRF domain-containing protein [Deltaproteobacteria bacterium]